MCFICLQYVMEIDKINDWQQLQNGWNNVDLANELIDLFDSSKIDLYGRDLENIDFLLPYKDKFSQIKILDLAGNNLKEIPSWISEFINLETLNLEWNLIRTLPVEIVNLKNLKTLKLAGNLIWILPHEIWELNLDKLVVDELKPENENLRSKIPNIEEVMVDDCSPDNYESWDFDDDDELA